MLVGRRSLPTVMAAALFAACLPETEGENPNLEGQTVRLTVLHTTDIHSRLLPYDLAPLKTDRDLGLSADAPPYGGAARLAALIKRERSLADRTLLLDSGDYFQGGPIFNANTGEPEVKFMSLMGYDASVLGNHEFDMGPQNLADKLTRYGTFPLLTANYLWENTNDPNAHGLSNLTSPYSIVNVRGVKVGIIGMASTSSMYGLMDGGNSTQATPLEQNETARAYIELLQPVVDFIVVLSHLGLTEDQDLLTGYDAYYPYENAKPFLERARNPWVQVEPTPAAPGEKPNTFPDGTVRVFIPGVSGIDIIEGGHLHVVLNPPQVIRDPQNRPVLISHSGAFAKYLGRLDLQVAFPPAKPNVPEDSQEMQNWRLRKYFGAEVIAHDYKAFPIDKIWCDEEARSWAKNDDIAYDPLAFKELIDNRPVAERPYSKAGPDQERCYTQARSAMAAAGWPAENVTACLGHWAANSRVYECDQFLPKDCLDECTGTLWTALESTTPDKAEECIRNYYKDYRTYDCDRFLPSQCQARVERCVAQEDLETTHMLTPYISQLDSTFALPRIFAYAPKNIVRRNSSTGGDSPLGNMTSESMRVRRRVEAEFALTNTLGIRDNLYSGPVTLESMFNVFPFENTINIMYLSGAEVQELTDYVGERSAERGCQAQAQVSGITFTMDCWQAQLNWQRIGCDTNADCAKLPTPNHPDGWRCTEEKVCWAHTSFDVEVAGKTLIPQASYKIAVNDYIAKGGSGFKVLKRNTTRIETGISLRDSLIDWLRGQCTCEDILGISAWTAGVPDAEKRAASTGEGMLGASCARAIDQGQRIIDPMVLSWCRAAQDFKTAYEAWLQQNTGDTVLEGMPDLPAGRCTCQQILNSDEKACGHVTTDLRNFCQAPTRVPIAVGEEDGRIGRRVK